MNQSPGLSLVPSGKSHAKAWSRVHPTTQSTCCRLSRRTPVLFIFVYGFATGSAVAVQMVPGCNRSRKRRWWQRLKMNPQMMRNSLPWAKAPWRLVESLTLWPLVLPNSSNWNWILTGSWMSWRDAEQCVELWWLVRMCPYFIVCLDMFHYFSHFTVAAVALK